MNNKFKIILIAVEVFALVVLLLIGAGCQRRWIIITGDGPRFDWYTVKEDLVPNLGSLLIPGDKETEPSEEPTVETETSETTEPATEPPRPVVTTPPETSPSQESTEETTEETTEPSESTVPTENWETKEF